MHHLVVYSAGNGGILRGCIGREGKGKGKERVCVPGVLRSEMLLQLSLTYAPHCSTDIQ